MVLATLALLLATGASAGTITVTGHAKELVDAAQDLKKFQQIPKPPLFSDEAGVAFGQSLSEGLWGNGAVPPAQASAAQTQPLNAGFKSMGQSGQVLGPVMGLRIPGVKHQGDGSYQVLKNEPDEVSFVMATGYISGKFTLKRSGGADTLTFSGKLWNMSAGDWGAPTSFTSQGQVTFSGGSGVIKWAKDGQPVSDRYSVRDGGGLNIEFNGYEHQFIPN